MYIFLILGESGHCEHLAEAEFWVQGFDLLGGFIQQRVLQRHQHHVEPLARQLLGDGLADPCTPRNTYSHSSPLSRSIPVTHP